MATAKKLPSGSWRCLAYSHTETVWNEKQGMWVEKRIYESFTGDAPSPRGRKEAELAMLNIPEKYAMERQRKSPVNTELFARRRRDSNPRAGMNRQTHFECAALRPLRYVSNLYRCFYSKHLYYYTRFFPVCHLLFLFLSRIFIQIFIQKCFLPASSAPTFPSQFPGSGRYNAPF